MLHVLVTYCDQPIQRRLRGSGVARDTGKSASFRSCVRCEAVCGREMRDFRGWCFGISIVRTSPMSFLMVSAPISVFSADRCGGFKKFDVILLTGTGVLRDSTLKPPQIAATIAGHA